jgi:hypothetical protein
MKFRLRLESLDNDPEERDFESAIDAIDYAQHWFLEGYANDTIDDSGRSAARAHVPKLRAALHAGHEFACSMFYERISFVPPAAD